MITRMTKEQFIESMQDAKEKEYINMADMADVEKEVKKTVKNNTGKAITRLAEPKRGRKPKNENNIKIPANWQRRIKESIDLMLAESNEKMDQAGRLIGEAEELTANAETLEGMLR